MHSGWIYRKNWEEEKNYNHIHYKWTEIRLFPQSTQPYTKLLERVTDLRAKPTDPWNLKSIVVAETVEHEQSSLLANNEMVKWNTSWSISRETK